MSSGSDTQYLPPTSPGKSPKEEGLVKVVSCWGSEQGQPQCCQPTSEACKTHMDGSGSSPTPPLFQLVLQDLSICWSPTAFQYSVKQTPSHLFYTELYLLAFPGC
ncbi:hypothetical protein DPEC_G00254650 [Dallia pectoralis]|uniref:Uncharacterized protein n=1 Tax=Dallia pectoralis TaxID=75939 RepID=A0ACC2FUE4_DALPE|nr:hypothetical protein DPEC_G00254650 [Dallia pectoralis]